MVKIIINIDKLVLEGFDYHDHLRISRAMQQELVRLVSEYGLPKTEGAPAINAGGAIHIGENLGPRTIGMQVAQSIYRSLGVANE